MLPLSSDRWATLKTHFGTGDETVPILARWEQSIGRYGEQHIYAELFEQYLHQLTPIEVAYAVVPHLSARLDSLPLGRRVEVIDHISRVEAARATPRSELETMAAKLRGTCDADLAGDLVRSMVAHHPVLPGDLAGDYEAAVAEVRQKAVASLTELADRRQFTDLLAAVTRFCGHAGLADLLSNLDTLHVECACGAIAVPRRLEQSGYLRLRTDDWRDDLAYLLQKGWSAAEIRQAARFIVLAEPDGFPGGLVHTDRDELSAALASAQLARPETAWSERVDQVRKDEWLWRALQGVALALQRGWSELERALE